MTFSEVLDAAYKLSVDEQETLIEILQRRLAECRPAQLVRDVAEARAEFVAGKSQPASVSDIMDEVRGES